jgi:hypothetical protein
MKSLVILVFAYLILVIPGCGKPGVDINNSPYNPKITVEGYLYPGQAVSGIKLMRNFPLGNSINVNDLYLTPAGNSLTATINGNVLTFDPKTQTYFNDQIMVDYGKPYTLEVFATIDGAKLHTTSTTITPLKGFSVLNHNLGNFNYGDSIYVKYVPSPGTGFYSFSIVPDTASTANFIYNNNLRRKLTPTDVANDLNQYEFRYGNVNNIDSYSNLTYSFFITSRNTWFYSSYTVVAYACDENFKDYLLTSPSVQEIDGNFHEPIETFQGDGIGVFGSAISDTVKFSIIK